jgi:hypothetical protein
VSGEGFDRLRPRTPATRGSSRAGAGGRPADPQGRQSLFSATDPAPGHPVATAAPGGLTVTCSVCRATSVVTPRSAVPLALPSLHLPLVKRGHPSWMRCPACRRRTWVRLGLRV